MKKTLLSILVVLVAAFISGTIFLVSNDELMTYEVRRQIAAPKEIVWKHISQVGEFHHIATGLHEVKILSGDGLGMVRRCTDKEGKSWNETCILWDPGKSFIFEVDTKAKDYPLPMDRITGTFTIESVDPINSTIVVRFDFKMKWQYKAISWLFGRKMKEQSDKNSKEMLDNWENTIINDPALKLSKGV